MNKSYSSENIQEIIRDIDNKNFKHVMVQIETILKNYPNLNLSDWENEIKIYEKNFNLKLEKFKIYINIGVILFKLGKINKSVIAFKKSIENNPNFGLAYNNLGVSFLELGMFQKASKYFALALKINKNDLSAQKHLINIFNLVLPENSDNDTLINLNLKIKNLIKNLNIEDSFINKNIKKILMESKNLISNSGQNINFNETQIFRKNSKNLNCFRHFKVFNEFNIIPKYCFSCYKIQINLETVVDLIKLFLIFDKVELEKNNTRKCIIETRNKIEGNYKGYIYCRKQSEAESIKNIILQIMKEEQIVANKITLKHGCSEFYESYPKFEKININNNEEFKYNNTWEAFEKVIDSREPKRIESDKKIWSQSVKGINLSDILIINNWISYAQIIGDESYKKIYDRKLNNIFIEKLLEDQLEFRNQSLTLN